MKRFDVAGTVEKLKWNLVGILGKLVVDVLFSTTRIDIFGARSVQPLIDSRKFICAIWHSRILLPLYLSRGVNGAVLASQSKDGEIIARILQRYGHKTIRGSSTRGGLRAMSKLIRCLTDQQKPGMIIPDGPQGPRFRAQPGIIFLARKTGFPIIPIGYSAQRLKVFSSWDRFIVPYPFTRCRIAFGNPVHVAPDAGESEEKQCLAQIEQELCRITFDLDRSFGHSLD